MQVEIVSNNDENFTIQTNKFGEVFLASDGERVSIGTTEQEAIDGVKDMQDVVHFSEPEPETIPVRGKIPAPLENPQGIGWFDGTSWGTK